MKKMPTFSSMASNINQLWASLFIEELLRHGISDFCIAPGSRSTPLTLAVANNKKATSHIHIDERGLGFLALGISQASQKPVVVITTSGTAVANLYPAVIEAKQSGLPLIIISADRPVELLNCGANQAIDQHGIFANYPIFFAQIVQPTTEIKANYLLTTLDHGLQKQQKHPAPIHFNFAFSEPLYPTEQQVDYSEYLSSLTRWSSSTLPFTEMIQTQSSPLPTYTITEGKKVLIVLGKMLQQEENRAVTLFCASQQIPLFADIQSSQKGAQANLTYYDLLLMNDAFINTLMQADIIIQFGEQLISKRLTTFMGTFKGQLHIVSPSEQRIDQNHQANKRYNCTATEWVEAHSNTYSTTNKQWLSELQRCNQSLKETVIAPFIQAQPISEMGIIEQLDKQLLIDAPLFIGNSMPIRLADMLMSHNQATIYSNRGASGIDGLLATAIGVAKKTAKPTTLLIGDNSFLYDLNSLALLQQLNTTFIIIVINNDGGAIFNLLPVPETKKESFYQLPHGLNFKASCEQFAIDYFNPNQLPDFSKVYNHCLQGKHSLIEISLENQQTALQLEQLKEQIKYATL